MYFFLVILLLSSAIFAGEPVHTAEKGSSPSKELLLQIPPYANASAGVIDLTFFDPDSVLLDEIMSFTGLDELLKDLRFSHSEIGLIAFGSEIQSIGQADYYVIRFRKKEAKKQLNSLMSLRGARRDGGRIFFGHGRKYAELLSATDIYIVHASREMRDLPRSRTLKTNKLVRFLFQDKPNLAMHYSWDIKEKNEFADRESTCKTASLTIEATDRKNPVYHMQTLYNCIDFQLVSDELQSNLRRELVRKDMGNVIYRLKVKVDKKKNKIMFFTKVGTWEPGEFESLLDSLDINGRVKNKTKRTGKE